MAYLVLAHDDLEGLEELVRTLAPAPVVIHADKPFHDRLSRAEVARLEACGASLVATPECVHWGGFSVLEAMVKLLEAGIQRTSADRFTFLSGRCFPLRPPAEFEAQFSGREDLVWCRAFPLVDGTEFMGLDRVQRRHHLDGVVGHARKKHRALGGAFRKVLLRLPMPGLNAGRTDVHCGSQWISMPRALGEELVRHHRSGGFDFLRDSFAPDEMAFQTYVHTSEWARRTPAGGAEQLDGRPMSAFANFHWLRADLQGDVSQGDLEAALRGEGVAFFIRKMPAGVDGARLRDMVKATWV